MRWFLENMLSLSHLAAHLPPSFPRPLSPRTPGWGKRLVLPRQGIPEGELGQLIGMEVLGLLRGL